MVILTSPELVLSPPSQAATARGSRASALHGLNHADAYGKHADSFGLLFAAHAMRGPPKRFG
jgi:hypothetical protein